MATGNFYCKNTSKIFALGSNHYTTQEEIDEYGWDQELLGTLDEAQTQANYEADLDYAKELLKGKGWDVMNEYDRDSNRSFPATIIGEKTKCVTFAGVTMEITMQAKVVSGYYEGACFDLEASLQVFDRDDEDVCFWNDFDDVYNIDKSDVISDNWQGNIGLTKIHAQGIVEAKDKLFNELRDEAEAAFQQASEYRLGCMGHGSNGEAFYIDLDKQNEQAA
jgi:hypothetical protein